MLTKIHTCQMICFSTVQCLDLNILLKRKGKEIKKQNEEGNNSIPNFEKQAIGTFKSRQPEWLKKQHEKRNKQTDCNYYVPTLFVKRIGLMEVLLYHLVSQYIITQFLFRKELT